MTLYQHHLPGEVRVFRYLSPPIRADDVAVVCDGWYSAEPARIYCRSYMFVSRWLHVFATFDNDLVLREDTLQGFPFAFNCDITTPHFRLDNRLYTTDLCVDVLVSADGRRCLVKDDEVLSAMRAAGEFGDLWRDAALSEVSWVKGLVSQSRFINFLKAVAPFPTVKLPTQISEVSQCQLASTDFLFHPSYPRYA
jgi:hypothetical protein